MGALESFWWKSWRANHHLKTLSDEIAAFLEPDCYEIVSEFDLVGEADGRSRYIMRRSVIFSREPDLLRWGVFVGDVVSNLRSALDHLIFAISYSRSPNDFRNDRTTQFPITDSPDEFRRPKRRDWEPLHEIRGLPPEAQALVEGLQPYERGEQALKTDPLWLLREMTNTDKHRVINVVAWSAYSIALDITELYPDVRIHSHSVRPPGVIVSGTPLAEIDFSLPTSSQHAMKVDRDFQFTVAFDESLPTEGEPVPVVLYRLTAYVQGVIHALSRFVDPPGHS